MHTISTLFEIFPLPYYHEDGKIFQPEYAPVLPLFNTPERTTEIFPRVHFSDMGTLLQKFLCFESNYFLVKNKTKIYERLKIIT